MKTETNKILKILLSLIKLENKLSLIQALKIKTLFEELHDYKVKSVKRVTRLYLSGREGLQDYKRGRITKVFLRERESYLGPKL